MYEQIPAVQSSNVGSPACYADSYESVQSFIHLLRRYEGLGIGEV